MLRISDANLILLFADSSVNISLVEFKIIISDVCYWLIEYDPCEKNDGNTFNDVCKYY